MNVYWKMFNYAKTDKKPFHAGKVIAGSGFGDSHSYRILYAGPDPASNSRILIKKVFRTNLNTYFYEDVRIDVEAKTVHTKCHQLMHDIKEGLTNEELMIRLKHRSHMNILGFSLFWKQLQNGKNHLSIIENVRWKPYNSWTTLYNDYFMRRDAFSYIKARWYAH
uniref:Uncharacterized protein n=1 Tax=Euplotes harpa TaxID=151035 RepID=A0A7S3JD30_9SPIT|mmetsp:Transcript_28601/g.32690  ORF Transcript_28601/g.32690 Transcript_28601/m.32690 type:complete len:165 (+) Transcript_28601:2-496(+)